MGLISVLCSYMFSSHCTYCLDMNGIDSLDIGIFRYTLIQPRNVLSCVRAGYTVTAREQLAPDAMKQKRGSGLIPS